MDATSQGDFYSTTLPNGLHVIAQPLAGVQSVAAGFLVGTGARDESWEFAGISHLTEATMFRGTENMSSRQLNDRLDRLGVGRSSTSGIEMSMFSAVALGDRLLPALEILTDVIRRPAFPEEDFEAVRGLQLQEIGQREDQPAQLAMDRMRQLYFSGSRFGNDVLGTRESVSGINRDQVVEYWRARYTPNNVILAVAGKFDWEPLLETVDRLTAGWEPGQGRLTLEEPGINPTTTVYEMPGAQENLTFAFPGVPNADPMYYPAALVSMVLGGGMNSRLFTEVREKRGLAYSVGARFDGMEKTGLTRVVAGTQPERASETLEVVQAELAKLEEHGVTPDELELAKTRLKSRVVMNSESTGNRMMSIGRDWWYEQRFRRLSEIRQEIDAVDVSAVAAYLSRIHLTENVGRVAIGPLNAAALGLEPVAFEVG